jgi:hypothetical protein
MRYGRLLYVAACTIIFENTSDDDLLWQMNKKPAEVSQGGCCKFTL